MPSIYKYVVVSLFCLLAAVLLPNRGFSQISQPDLLSLNRHAQLSLEDYPTVYARTYNDYIDMLGEAFKTKMTSMGPGAIVVDAGAGLGVALIPMVDQLGMRGYAINAQDMLSPVHGLAGRVESDPALIEIEPSYYRDSTDERGRSCNFRVQRLGPYFQLGPSVPLPLTDLFAAVGMVEEAIACACLPTSDPAEVIANLRKLSERLRTPPISERFFYEVAYVEEVITKPPYVSNEEPPRGEVELLTDVYGAFFYSADRANLLEMYHNALTATGRAFVYAMFTLVPAPGQIADNQWLRLSRVRLGDRTLSLLQFLTTCFNEQFSLTTTRKAFPQYFDTAAKQADDHVLTIQRASDQPLELGLIPMREDPDFGEYLDTIASTDNGFPILHYYATHCPSE